MSTSELFRTTWTWHPLLAAALVAAVLAHVTLVGLRRPTRTLAMAAAVAAVVLALMSPVAFLAGGYLFSAHMLQHMLLVLAAPPLVLLALPSVPASRRQRRRMPEAACWALGVGAMWIWHAPTLCNAAAASASVRAVQSVTLFAMGAAFWWPLLDPCAKGRLDGPAAVAYLFAACAACTLLGVALTFSPAEVCTAYLHPVDTGGALRLVRERWGLTPAVDQQAGGLLMWVPGCLVYAGAILTALARWYAAPPALEEAS